MVAIRFYSLCIDIKGVARSSSNGEHSGPQRLGAIKRTEQEDFIASAQSLACDLEEYLHTESPCRTLLDLYGQQLDGHSLTLMEAMCTTEGTSHGAIQYEFNPVARAFYASTSLLNHSCDPNILLSYVARPTSLYKHEVRNSVPNRQPNRYRTETNENMDIMVKLILSMNNKKQKF